MSHVTLTERQAKIKKGLDSGKPVATIAKEASVSRAAVYATARRLTVLNPTWAPKTPLGKRSSGDKTSKVAAPQNSEQLGHIIESIRQRRATAETQLGELQSEISLLAAAEKVLT